MSKTRAYWHEDAACRGMDPEELFGDTTGQKRATAVCRGCAVRIECLAEALDHGLEWGVWGGMTERERRALLRRRPHVASWRQLLTAPAPPGGPRPSRD
ncbi:WhiB family transcriptional regulator [Streptomyces sp. NPDC001941]|uniref:WhiB family transcriptional regulator n=1 Tax=Streptomyces sp. NPDC001941 TaxID=3154659 RepID=UPI003329187C